MTAFPARSESGAMSTEYDHAQIFELAPVSLWLEDYSGIRQLFDTCRAAGVVDLRAWLKADSARVHACSEQIRVLQVNRRTLELYEAQDLEQLVTQLDRVFRDDMLDTHIEELVQLWEGQPTFGGKTVNYTLGGRRLDIELKGTILQGHESTWDRVLLAIEDVTEKEQAKRRLEMSEAYARGLFENSPVSLWVEDFSAVKHLLEDIRSNGIEDFRVFTDVHPEFVERFMREIRVIDVNQHTLSLFQAADKQTLLENLNLVFRDDMRIHFREQLIDLWNDRLFHQYEVINYALNGDLLHLHLQFSVMPGHEENWDLALVALTDITARKKAEAYLEYLGKHDVLTKLYNRSFYVDELNRLQRKGPTPVSVLVIDLNGLKPINDQLGHAVGDALLRRAGEVLNKAVEKPAYAARIGGDEFVVLMPATDERGCAAMADNINKLVELNNQFYPGATLSLSIGMATSEPHEHIEDTVRRADLGMYEHKKAYYASLSAGRRHNDPQLTPPSA
jgi:diguanylate cyclase (GGDEF)-like protein